MKTTPSILWRLIALVICLAVTARSGYYMSTHFFWGHYPLFLLLFGWFSIQLLLWKRYVPSDKDKRWWWLATISGVLLSLGFPPSPLTPIIFLGFVPLLKMEDEISNAFSGQSKWRLFKLTYHAMVVWNILTTFWVSNSALAAGLFAIFVNALLMTLPVLAYHACKRTLHGRVGVVSIAAFWIAFEYMHMQWDLSWPWLTLGNTFARFPSWVQWYEYTGVFGGTLWIWAVAIVVFLMWKKAGTLRIMNPRLWVRPVMMIAVPIIISVIWYYNYDEEGEIRKVAVVQPNFNPHSEKFEVPFEQQMDRFIELSDKIVDAETDYLVFPETSFRADHRRFSSNPHIRRIRRLLEKNPEVVCVTGVNGYAHVDESLKDARTTRTFPRGTDTVYWESYNSAIQLEHSNPQIPVYLKSKLVPGPEIFPFYEILFFMEGLVDQLGGTVAGLKTQKQRSVFESRHGRVGPAICYESIYGEFCTGYVRHGAQAIFIVTNDGWWDKTAGHVQHLMFASLRAIELRRSIARSANTGISGYINQRGDRYNLTEYEVADAIQDDIYFNDTRTFYTKWGDIIARIAIFATIILLLNTIVRPYTDKIRKKEA